MKFPKESNIVSLAKLLFDCFPSLNMNPLLLPKRHRRELLDQSQWFSCDQTHTPKASCTQTHMGQPSIIPTGYWLLPNSTLLAMSLDTSYIRKRIYMKVCARLQTNEDTAIPAQKPSLLELRTMKLIFTFQVSQVISASMLHIRLFIIRLGSLKGTLKQNEIITYCL